MFPKECIDYKEDFEKSADVHKCIENNHVRRKYINSDILVKDVAKWPSQYWCLDNEPINTTVVIFFLSFTVDIR